mmetsp:Transcript_4983/g.5074  ORF Transcript_4983/g.5074 Transcript_4983/m.5074 type:complete len:262 (-) Transcript_4983:366-1151(-)
MSESNEIIEFSCLECPQLTENHILKQDLELIQNDTELTSLCQFIKVLNAIYRIPEWNWDEKRSAIDSLLRRTNLTTDEVNKYTFWDGEKPYTRNLIHTDNENYTLLLLCWNGGRESSIHNHPCEGCFIKTIRGCIRETRYEVVTETDEIRQSKVKFFNEGQVSFMHDSIGLHKIGNPNKDTGSVTLHLYTPPFKTCNVWSDSGRDTFSHPTEVKMGYFSVYGHRSPNLEGRPGKHAQVMNDIPTYASQFYEKVNKKHYLSE